MITIQIGIAGNPPGWPQYTHWGCYYVDPSLGLVGDGQWHNKEDFITFANVNTGGYPTAIIVNTWDDPQVPSDWFNGGPFWGEDGRRYLFNIEDGNVYILPNGEEEPEEPPPDDEKPLNTWLIVGGIAVAAILGIVLVRK